MTSTSTLPSDAPMGLAPLQGRPDLVVRPAAERFHSAHGWLDSWHSFSFAGHDDPAWRGFGPLLVINDDRIAAGGGFGMHPHSNMEIITVMVDGVLRHQDSMGHSEALRAGEVQRMSAGTGIVHSEVNGSDQPCHLLQIWITPSSRGITPSYGQKAFPCQPGWTLLIDPDASQGAMAIHRPVRLWRGRPAAGSPLPLPLAADAHGWIQVINGSVAISGGSAGAPLAGTLTAGDGLGFAPGLDAAVAAGSPGADLLVFELR
jgi:redox-sensitive bicupin YhaK (pirin superfamily)